MTRNKVGCESDSEASIEIELGHYSILKDKLKLLFYVAVPCQDAVSLCHLAVIDGRPSPGKN